jgi:hypothetical protein
MKILVSTQIRKNKTHIISLIQQLQAQSLELLCCVHLVQWHQTSRTSTKHSSVLAPPTETPVVHVNVDAACTSQYCNISKQLYRLLQRMRCILGS